MRFSWITRQTRNFLLLLVAIDIVFFILTAVSFRLNPYFSLTISLLMLILTIYIMKNLKRLEKGTDDEDAVRLELQKLPPEYTHLNDFNYNNQSSTDIVVIGPTGVFTIEVKNYHAKEITFRNEQLHGDGKLFEKNVLGQAYAEMKHLQNYLATTAGISIPVHPILVFTKPGTIIRFGKNPVRGVYVVGIPWVNKIIEEQPIALTQEQCLAIRNEIQKHTSIM